MILEQFNINTKIIHSTDDERAWLDSYLAFPDKQAFFKRGKMPAWKQNDKIKMLNEHTASFPSGFLEAVIKQASVDSVRVEVKDSRTRSCVLDPQACIDWLRDYQHEAIDVARTKERGIFHHCTGAGKTELMVALGELYPCTWLILTHRKDLLFQTADRFARRTGEEIGVIGEGKSSVRRITIAMFQTIFAGLKKAEIKKFLASRDGIMVDEVHVAPAHTFLKVLSATTGAYLRYGFSGTPFERGDKKSIYTWGSVGPIIHRIPAKRLIDAGVLAEPEIRMLTVKQHPPGKTWREVYDSAIVQSPQRNAGILQAVRMAEKPCLVFVKDIKHGKALESTLRQGGEKVEFVWGTHHTKVRKAAIERLVLSESDVLICSVIFQEGIDIPELQSIVIAQGGKSIIAALQRVGRGMRKHDRSGAVMKSKFEVYDIKDKGCGCRSPKKHMGCRWIESHARHRMAAYASEKYRITEEDLNQLALRSKLGKNQKTAGGSALTR